MREIDKEIIKQKKNLREKRFLLDIVIKIFII
jgi:hypothetical protein